MHKETSSAKDFFLHLLSSITLYMSAIAFLMIAYQLIGFLFPDASLSAWRGDYSSEELRTGISMFLIAFPVFVGTRIFVAKMYEKHSHRKSFALRKWLIYLTMFVAALIILISLITTVNTFLSGELTARFGLKALVTMLVAFVMFSYYLQVIKNQLTRRARVLYLWGTIIVSVVLIISTFMVVGSPKQARLNRLDTERVSHLTSLTYSIESYYAEHEALPESLDAFPSIDTRYEDTLHDPLTGEAYRYEVKGNQEYALCASFDRDTTDKTAPRDSGNGYSDEWRHPSGVHCFERDIEGVDVKPVRAVDF